MAQFFQVFSAEGAIDHAVITAHRERHAMARDDLVAIVHYRDFRDPANSENETLRRIMTAEKLSMHMPPRFETVNVPP